MARKVKTRQQNAPIPTIIGAGITEQWYFTHLQRILGYRVKVRPRFFGQEDIFQLTKKSRIRDSRRRSSHCCF